MFCWQTEYFELLSEPASLVGPVYPLVDVGVGVDWLVDHICLSCLVALRALD